MDWYTYNAAYASLVMTLTFFFFLWCWLFVVPMGCVISTSIHLGLYAGAACILWTLWAHCTLLRTYAALLYLSTRASACHSSSRTLIDQFLCMVCGMCTLDLMLSQ